MNETKRPGAAKTAAADTLRLNAAEGANLCRSQACGGFFGKTDFEKAVAAGSGLPFPYESIPPMRLLLQPISIRLCLLALSLFLSACNTPGPRQEMPRLIAERLSWMDDVAEYKQAKSLPILDPAREAQLLEAMVAKAPEHDLPPAAVRAFFSGQMAAARQVQQEWLAAHPAQAARMNRPLPDLTGTVRPALDALGKKLLPALATARKASATDQAQMIARTQARLAQQGYSKAATDHAVGGLAEALRVR